MSNDNQPNYPRQEPPHDPNQPITQYQASPIPNYSDLPVPSYPDPSVPATQDYGRGLQGGKLPGPSQKRNNFWKIVAMVMSVLAIIFAIAADLAYNHIINPPAANTVVTQQPKSTPLNDTPTSAATITPTSTSATTPSTTTTASQPSSPNNYSALQPGPGCDTNGGIWTPQGLANITCGTQISDASPNTRGYLFLQLQNNKAFSANNKVGVIGNPGGGQCIGLDEQDANTGFLVTYCGDGSWFIYTISSDGTIVQTLDKNITSTRRGVDISLTLKGTTLSFSIDNEVHNETITPIQPTKVAITYVGSYDVTVNNFSYSVLAN